MVKATKQVRRVNKHQMMTRSKTNELIHSKKELMFIIKSLNKLEEVNFKNLEIIKLENISNLSLKFKNREVWPERSLNWASQVDYTYLENFVWDENGEGRIITRDQISFYNSPFKYYIVVDNRFSFTIDAFVE